MDFVRYIHEVSTDNKFNLKRQFLGNWVLTSKAVLLKPCVAAHFFIAKNLQCVATRYCVIRSLGTRLNPTKNSTRIKLKQSKTHRIIF